LTSPVHNKGRYWHTPQSLHNFSKSLPSQSLLDTSDLSHVWPSKSVPGFARPSWPVTLSDLSSTIALCKHSWPIALHALPCIHQDLWAFALTVALSSP
jgi:hypothetical protein